MAAKSRIVAVALVAIAVVAAVLLLEPSSKPVRHVAYKPNFGLGASAMSAPLFAPNIPAHSSKQEAEEQKAYANAKMPKGCTRGGENFRTHGIRGKKWVALTFDDGPSDYTQWYLKVLRYYKAHATFFELGSQMAGREALMRQILREGNEIANHSFSHKELPKGDQLMWTNARMRKATGFQPCLFRPPYGTVNGALVQRAKAHGLMTINWDVDPRDWSLPGVKAIVNRVMGGVHGGSIVVMHDGGGPRTQTLEALKIIMKKLNAKGYKVVTVTKILGHKFRY